MEKNYKQQKTKLSHIVHKNYSQNYKFMITFTQP